MRIAGGVLAIIAGGFSCFMHGPTVVFSLIDIATVSWYALLQAILQVTCAVLALVGGILLCTDKASGGTLAIIGGGGLIAVHLMFTLLTSGDPLYEIMSYAIWYIVYALGIIGGIMGLASDSEA